MNEEQKPHIVVKGRFFDIDDRTIERTRRLFGLNFTMAVALLIGTLYFVWPLMFEDNEPKIPESVVREVYTVTQMLMDRVRVLDDSSIESVQQAIETHPAFQQKNGVSIYVIDTSGNVVIQNTDQPAFWKDAVLDILSQPRNIRTVEQEEKNWFLMHEILVRDKLIVIVAKEYPAKDAQTP